MPASLPRREQIDKERAGVVVGSGLGGVNELASAVETLATNGSTEISSLAIPLTMSNAASALIAMDPGIGFMGPNYSISAACATANHCLLSAADQIRLGRAAVVLAGVRGAVAEERQPRQGVAAVGRRPRRIRHGRRSRSVGSCTR
jgi:3-oxoacyl-[acyl-carrier-protein] synthase II